jgi:hypothetical protein
VVIATKVGVELKIEGTDEDAAAAAAPNVVVVLSPDTVEPLELKRPIELNVVAVVNTDLRLVEDRSVFVDETNVDIADVAMSTDVLDATRYLSQCPIRSLYPAKRGQTEK